MCWSKKYGCALLVILLCLSGCNKAETKPVLKEQSDFSFVEYEVEQKDLNNISYVRGIVEAKQYEQHFVKEGNIEQVTVYPGDKVKKGDLLAVMECEKEKKAVESAQNELNYHIKQADNTLKQQELGIQIKQQQIRENQQLQGSIEDIQELQLQLEENQEQLRYQREMSNLQIKQDRESLAKRQKELKENYLYASHSGTVSFTVNSFGVTSVVAKQTVVAIASNDEFYITPNSSILESEVADMQGLVGYINGEQVKLQYDVINVTEGGEIKPCVILPIVNGTEAMVGYTAIIGLVKQRIKSATVVPEQTINNGMEGSYVYLKSGDKKTKTPVTTGRRMDGYVQITSGLKPGQVILGYEGVRLIGEYKEEKVTRGTLEDTLDIPGFYTRVANKYICVNTWGKCIFQKFMKKDGDLVKKGDPLFTVKLTDTGNAEFEGQSQIIALEKSYLQQKEELEKSYHNINLKEPGSQQQAEQIKLQLSGLKMQYEHDKKQLEEQVNEMASQTGEKTIYSPVDGYAVSYSDWKKGNTIEKGRVVMLILDPDKNFIHWYNEEELQRLESGMTLLGEEESDFSKVGYGMQITIGEGKEKLTGHVVQAWNSSSKYGVKIDYESGREVPEQIILTDKKINDFDSLLNGSEVVKATATKYRIKNGIIISNHFLYKDADRYYVWVKNKEQIERRYVTVGIKQEEKSWILDGLSEGETVVTDREV